MSEAAGPVGTERLGRTSDPVLRLKALVDAMFDITSDPAPLARALTIFHLRLAESRPQDLAQALEPFGQLVTGLLAEMAEAGLLRDDLDVRVMSALVPELLLASAHSLGLAGRHDVSAPAIWSFCLAPIVHQHPPPPYTLP